jgi:hypothetical protein
MSLVAQVNDGNKINTRREATVSFTYRGGGDSLLSSVLQIIINNFRKAADHRTLGGVVNWLKHVRSVYMTVGISAGQEGKLMDIDLPFD